jgi:excisionase family DNA binding protein
MVQFRALTNQTIRRDFQNVDDDSTSRKRRTNSRNQNLSRGDKEAVTLSEFPNRRSRRDQINFFTIAEVAERLRVSTRTVRRWMDAGDLVAHRLGGTIRIAEGDLRAFLAQHREG